jgi:hypothetical protein
MFPAAGLVMEVGGGLEGSKTSGMMRRRVSKLADSEWWWEKEEIFLGREGDELGLEFNCS